MVLGNKPRKPVVWMGDSKKRLKSFPPEPKQRLTYGILLAELGQVHPDAKTLTGIDALEIPCDYDTDTFRAVYTAILGDCVYVLHCFKKKSKKGVSTPRPDIAAIRTRLKEAKALYEKEKANKRNQARTK